MLRDNCALVIGASSGIGAAVAEHLARDGYRLALVARRESELDTLCRRINDRARDSRARAYAHDVTNTAEIPALFERIVNDLGGLSIVVYAAGVMPQVGRDEYNIDKDRPMIEVHVTGMVAWLNQAADLFGRLQTGVICGIGSIAGDRGRAGQPVYNATKGAQAIYLEALRNRLDPLGVRVVTIKPGPVDTSMTRNLGPMPFMITADEVGRRIVAAIKTSRSTVYVPARWRLIMWVIRSIPSCIFRRLNMQ